VRWRAGRLAGRHTAAREAACEAPEAGHDAEEPGVGDDSSPRKRARWFSRPPAAAALITTLAVGVVVIVTPADGAAGDIASGFARAVRGMVSTSHNAKAFGGAAPVGALFTTSAGKLGTHFCTASVVNSPNGDLVVTAAHCMNGVSHAVFVPGYDHGSVPYGVWTVSKVYTDKAWKASADPDDDFAFLQVSQAGSIVPIEDVTGAEQLETGTAARQLVEVIGYPDGGNAPIVCRNWTKKPMSDQLEFDCGGYTDGTSGGPFLADVNSQSGQGKVIGVIGGYEQGGNTPQVSYSSMFGTHIEALYQTAVAGG
jgi:V8-like Glu-specific endopeptidase